MAKANQVVQTEVKTEEKPDLDFTAPVVVTAAPIDPKEVIRQRQATKLIELVKAHGTKSQMIRALSAAGMKRTEIKALTGLRYQHIRNVLITPIKAPKVVVQVTEEKEVEKS